MSAVGLDEVLAQVKQAPKGKYENMPKKGPENKEASKSPKVEKKAEGGKDGNAHQEPLPAQLKAQYPDADLSAVKVLYDSPEAAKRGVQGFAMGDTIELAPGVDKDKVLAHEVAHVVQQQTGKNESQPASAAQAEKKAEEAETKKLSSEELGSAPAGKALNKEGTEKSSGNDRGIPKITWDGFTFQKAEGEFVKTLAESEWKEKELFNKEAWWRFPAFPAGGLYIKGSSYFSPEASIKAKGAYCYNNKEKSFEVKGALEGELKAGITFAVEGGAGLNLVFQRGGVGLEASATLEAGAKLSKSISFKVSEKGVAFAVTPFEFDLSALLKAGLAIAVWTKGWFADKRWKWTFAEWNIASLTGYKAVIEISGGGGEKLFAGYKHVLPGTFKWGSPPEATDANGRKE